MLNLKIITPDGIFFNSPVSSVTLKTTEGYITILEWHTPLIANIVISSMMYKIKNAPYHLSIAGGLLISTAHEISIITDKIEYLSVLKAQEDVAISERIKKVSSS